MENTTVSMIRPDLDNIPAFAYPEGVRVRWYRPGDEETWIRINASADQFNKISIETFRKEYNADAADLARRMFFLEDASGHAFGTTSAWYHTDPFGIDRGLIHWVAIEPEWQGRGIAKPMMSTVLTRMRELGHSSVWLNTSTARVPAIRLYVKFGFVPFIHRPTDEETWKKHAEVLGVNGVEWFRGASQP